MDRLPFSHSEMSNIQDKIFTMIAAHVDRQGDKSLSKMEFDTALFCLPHQCLPRFIPLLKACTEWTVQTLLLQSSNSCFSPWVAQFARISAKGHIGELVFFCDDDGDAFPKSEIKNVKALWEISEELAVVKVEGGWGKVRCVGRRGEGPKMTWEEVYESFLEAICY